MIDLYRTPCALATALLLIFAADANSQVRYARGQNVVPVYEGWEHNPDGSFNMVFGYMNRNYEEQVDVPVGPNNKIEPGAPDQGQPGHFYRRRQEYAFKIKVPKDWPVDKDLVWTLTSAGKTEKAYGTLAPIWELGNLVYMENRGGPGALSYPEEPNQAPTIEMTGSAQRTAKVGEEIVLSVQVSDDGYPGPVGRRGNQGGGRANAAADVGPRPESPISQAVVKLDPGVRLGVTWVVYRAGPGTVKFDPMRSAAVMLGSSPTPAGAPITGKATTKVTFSQPGTYVLRAYGDDGVLLAPIDVTVTVQ